MRLKIAIGGISHETNIFVQGRTTLQDFAAQGIYPGAELITDLAGTRSPIGGMVAGSRSRDWRIAPILYAAAMPGGLVENAAYEWLMDDLLTRLHDSLPLDGVLLALHGAMVTDRHLDVEADILTRVRGVVGVTVPVVVELDMHGNLSPEMVALADGLVAYQTNPHIDPFNKGLEAASILEQLLQGKIRPTKAYLKLPLLLPPQLTGTADLPLRPALERASQLSSLPGMVSIALMSGFAFADTPFTGVSVTATTNNDQDLAHRCVTELADLVMTYRHKARLELMPVDRAVQQAMTYPRRPILLVDSADNVGGGTPGDGTDALRAMISADVQEGAVMIADPEAVDECWLAGGGAIVSLRVGAKHDSLHGEPVNVTGLVKALSDGIFTCEAPDNHFSGTYGKQVNMGRTVWLRIGGVNLVLTERKTPPMDLAQFRFLGIIPEEQQMIVVKGAIAHRTAYLPIAAGSIEIDTRGVCTADLSRLNYRHIQRPIFPLDKINWPTESRAMGG